MNDEKFCITGNIYADTPGEICRALGECYTVGVVNGFSICFTRKV